MDEAGNVVTARLVTATVDAGKGEVLVDDIVNRTPQPIRIYSAWGALEGYGTIHIADKFESVTLINRSDPLTDGEIYYVILGEDSSNPDVRALAATDPSVIQLAWTPGDAFGGTAIDLGVLSGGTDKCRLTPAVTPFPDVQSQSWQRRDQRADHCRGHDNQRRGRQRYDQRRQSCPHARRHRRRDRLSAGHPGRDRQRHAERG